VAIDPAGALYVADTANHRVLRYAPPFANGMAATMVFGQASFTTAVAGNNRDELDTPAGVAVDHVGTVYTVDAGNERIISFDHPVDFTIDPSGDIDRDGIPNGVESPTDPFLKDNDVFGNARLFAMQQYRDFLGREGDAGGIAFYQNGIGNGSLTRAQVIENFFNSPEFAGVASPVARLYYASFLRTPDYDGLLFQINAFRSGATLAQIANNFTLSPEFLVAYGALNNAQFVALLYQNILGRAPVQSEIDFHVARLVAGATRGEVLIGFSESPEYQAAIGSEVYVTMMYVGMLRRAPEPAGLSYWVAYIDGGSSGQALISGFLNAAEYRARFLPF
jgi:hypothetical protein